MKRIFDKLGLVAMVVAIIMFAACWPVYGKQKPDRAPNETVVGLTESGQIALFATRTPETVSVVKSILGVPATERLTGLKYEFRRDEFYALSDSGQLYRLTGVLGFGPATATPVGLPFDKASGERLYFTFNPLANARLGFGLRLVSNRNRNNVVNQFTAQIAVKQPPQTYAQGDRSFGRTPNLAAPSYINNVPDVSATRLFLVDRDAAALVEQALSGPNTGQLTTVGTIGVCLPVETSMAAGRNNDVYLSTKFASRNSSDLFGIDATTGATRRIGTIGVNEPVIDITVVQRFVGINSVEAAGN